MPTTSNFGWNTPADTDLVKDGAAAIRTLGNNIDASLVDLKGGTTGQVLAKASNTDLDFSWVAQDDSNAIQNALLTTTGDTIYASASSTPARLGIGSTGQVLTVSGGVPVWATPAPSGKIAQVVQGLKTDSSTTTSQSFIATGVSVTITPTSNTSKILILSTINVAGSANTQPLYKLRRNNATDLFIGDAAGSRPQVSGQTFTSNSNYAATGNLIFLDSPATTSATTYEIYWRAEAASTVALNRTVTDNDGSNFGVRTASSIVAMEVLA